MAVNVKRKEPTEAPPAKEVVVAGNASGRGFRFYKSGSSFIFSGIGAFGDTVLSDARGGWTLRLRRNEALDLIQALTEVVTA